MSYHNTFTHQVLRDTALRLKSKIFAYLDTKCQITLNSRINELISNGNPLLKAQSEHRFNASHISVSHITIGNAPCIIISMPPPKDITGAYFIAIVSRIPDTEVQSRNRDEPFKQLPGSPVEECPINYYTLERAFDPDGEGSTRFCEWSELGHYNYCEGPAPTMDCFLPFLREVAVARAIEEGRTAVAHENEVQSTNILEEHPMFRLFWSGELNQ
jgi:hypothetical protein